MELLKVMIAVLLLAPISFGNISGKVVNTEGVGLEGASVTLETGGQKDTGCL